MTSITVLSAQQLLQRFRETHPELASLQQIVDFGGSGSPGHREERFVQQYAPELADGDREARLIYRTAYRLHEQAVLLWANLRDAVSPYLQQTLFNNLPKTLPDAFIAQQESTPSYTRLFGNLDFIECDHYRSIFGPAAYFVDLMRFIEQNITNKNTIPEQCRLQQRRPDLAQIRLDASETSDLVPYINLVNELLTAFVKTAEQADRDTYEVLKQEIFPLSLPFDLPLVEIRTYLAQLKTSLSEIYQAFKRPQMQDIPLKRLMTQEGLGLSAEEFSLLISGLSQETNLLEGYYGGTALTGPNGLENVEVFLEKTGLTHQQLNELITQDLDRHEVNAGVSRLFFINNVDDGLDVITLATNTDDAQRPFEQLLNLSRQKLDRIHRFLRLSRRLGWSFAELDQALRSLNPPYGVEKALQFDGINDHVVCSSVTQLDGEELTMEAWVNPSRLGDAVILSTLSNRDGSLDEPQRHVHFALGLTNDNRLAFYGRYPSGDPFEQAGTNVLPVNEFTHVAVTVTSTRATFYVNGKLDHEADLRDAIAATGSEVIIGGGLEDQTFAGIIKEVRLWNTARTQQEIVNSRYRRMVPPPANLVGYWPLTETVDNTLTDLSTQSNPGQMGGTSFVTQPRWVRRDLILDPLPHAHRPEAPAHTPEDYSPELIKVDRPVPGPPVELEETVLQLDGDNDVLVVTNQKNWGLGRFDRWTLEFWFKPTGQPDARANQVLFTQGDAEAGLNIYLAQNRLYVLEWRNTFEQTDFRSSLLTYGDPINTGTWYHIAVTHDEFPASPSSTSTAPELRAFINGTALKTGSQQEVGLAFRLSPVGEIGLGGLASGMITRFEDAYSEREQLGQHYFAGQLTELRVWRAVKSPAVLVRDRGIAPLIGPDLVAYLPLDRGETSWQLEDRAGHQHDNRFTGALQRRQMALQAIHTDANLANIYAHYIGLNGTGQNGSGPNGTGPDAIAWGNYIYAGRMRISTDSGASQKTDAIGVTVLSQYPKAVNQYYRLSRDANHPTFRLTAHPAGISPLAAIQGKTDSGIDPQLNVWYHFWIRVEDTGTQTVIQAKIWAAGEAEPADFQIDAYDDRPDMRLTSGTVGVWGIGNSIQDRQFDNLRVWSAAIDSPTPDELWMDASFDDPSLQLDSDGWQDMGDRIIPLPDSSSNDDRLFQLLEVSGRDGRQGDRVFGTASTLKNIHAYYYPSDNPNDDSSADVLAWKNYTFDGQLRITDAAGGIGVTVLSQHPDYTGPDHVHQYYSLRRDADHPAFHLTASPIGVQPLGSLGSIDLDDSGITPEIDTWYRFSIQVVLNEDEARTEIRAKVWRADESEPAGFQMEAYDDSSIRLQSGTVGVWATGEGSKYFDQLVVSQDVLLAENFQTYAANKTLDDWLSTGANNSREEAPSLFKTAEIGSTIAFGTQSNLEDIHSHYAAPGALDWKNYSYRGRLYVTGGNGGVTFLSRYPNPDGDHNYYYRLRANPGARQAKYRSFRIDAHRGSGSEAVVGSSPDDAFSRVTPQEDTWYRFRIDVEDTGSRTHIQAKMWKDGTPEPEEFHIDLYDEADDRLTAGTVGLWTTRQGEKYFDDLTVLHGNALMVDTRSGQWSELWAETPSRDRHETKTKLFSIVDIQDNQLQWVTSPAFPLVRYPLSPFALRFDGERESLMGQLDDAPLTLSRLTLSAWIRVREARDNPIVSLTGSQDGRPARLELGVSAQGLLTLTIDDSTWVAATPIDTEEFTYVAVRVAEDVTFFVNAAAETPQALPAPLSMEVTELTVGRHGDQYIKADIKELRLWTYRTDEQIAAGQFRRILDPSELSALLGYWPLEDDNGGKIRDRSSNGIDLEPGIPPQPPSPIGIALPDTGFWRAQRQVLRLDGSQAVHHSDSQEPRAFHQRTIEVWFQVVDKTLSQRKQVIYHEGDDQRGLLLYVYDGALYFVGYNTPANESQWRTSEKDNPESWQLDPISLRPNWRLKTERIESGRWHHAALVLDGRDEVRPESLRGYVDGRLAVVGPGSKLWQHKIDISLGGLQTPVLFHDGVSNSTGTGVSHGLGGGILQVRLWNGLRTDGEIASGWSQDIDAGAVGSTGATLDLLWNFDRADDVQIFDGVALPPLQTLRQSLQGISASILTRVTLDEETLHQVAAIKRLKDEYTVSIDRLTALWSSIRHTGREDGPPLFDQVFNPQDAPSDPWPYYLDQPIRWDITGQESPKRDRQIRSKLMQALQVSSLELALLVAYLKGGETILDLSGADLTQLYRLARLPKLLRLTIPEFLVLLDRMKLKTIDALADVLALSDRVAWMQRTQIDVAELIALEKSVETDHAEFYAEGKLRSLAQQLQSQGKGLSQSDASRSEAILQGMTEMLEQPADLVQVVIEHLDSLVGAAPSAGQRLTNAIDAATFMTLIDAIETADSPIPLNLSVYIAKVVKLLKLITKFELTAHEAKLVLVRPRILLSSADLLQPSLTDLERLAQFTQLKTEFGDEAGTIIDFLALEDAVNLAQVSADDARLRTLTDITGWEPRQVITLAKALEGDRHNRIEALSRFQRCFALAQQLGSDVDFLIELSDTEQLDYAFYRQQADVLFEIMRANYDEETWDKVYKPIRDQLAVQKRDALLALAMEKLPDDYLGRKSPDVLYEYFLLDVQVGSEVQTSRIVQATASLQLYVQRCLMNLEAGVDPSQISMQEWEWVKNYRVWEANRKVFLYPENYIEPELRRNKTPLFEELEQNLLQSDINQQAVERVYINYLDQFAELAKLKVVSSYLHRELDGDPNPGHETLYLIGRTDADPGLYYLRKQVRDDKGTRWLPWEKIDLAINSDFATPVYAFGKLILFWTEFMPLKKSQDRRLPQYIRDRYPAKLLQDLLDGVRDDIISLRNEWNRHSDRGDFWSKEVRSLEAMTPTEGHFKYLSDSLRRDTHTRVRDKKRYRTLRKFKQDIEAAIRLLDAARDSLESQSGLTPEEVDKLDQREWTIDDDHYLYDTRIVGRVQQNVDVYQTVVKYSYYNFGKTWISPQTYLETELSKEEYEQVKWHSLYAQRTIEFTPVKTETEPKQDKDPQVLQVDVNTTVSPLLPDFDMQTLTWSFWVKFDSFDPKFQYLGSTSEGVIDEELNPVSLRPEDVVFSDQEPKYKIIGRQTVDAGDLEESLTLLDYDHGRFRVTATNDVEPITGAQAREEAVAKAFIYTHAALQDINNGSPTAAALERALADLKEIPKSTAGSTDTGNAIVDRAINKARGDVDDAAKKKSAAVQARKEAGELRTAATRARGAATKARADANSEPEDSDNKQALQDAAAQAEGEATKKETEATSKENEASRLEREASDKISAARRAIEAAKQVALEQLEEEFQKPKWESKTVTLAVDFGNSEQALTTTLDMNEWRHVAIVLERTEKNSKSGYQTKIRCHQQNDDDAVDPIKHEKFLESRPLPQRESLEIGRQMASADIFTTQMSEFQLWNQERSDDAIKSERFNRRKTSGSVFSVPLNMREVSSNMTLVRGEGLTLTIPIEFQGDLPERLVGQRERIIIFYGDNVKSIRNSLKDQSFTLSFDSSTQENYDVRLRSYKENNSQPIQTALSLVKENNVSIRDFANTGEGHIFDAPSFTNSHVNFVIKKLQNQEVTFIDVHNRPGWYIVDTSDDQFLVKAVFLNNDGEELPVKTAAELMKVTFQNSEHTFGDQVPAVSVSLELESNQAPATNAASSVKFEFERLDTYAIYELSKNLFTGGIDKFLSLESQEAKELDFWAVYQPNETYVPRDRNPIPNQIDFKGANRLYFEEIFFHVPFLIANQLNANQQFEDAQKWYHYIFNPTAPEDSNGARASDEDSDFDRYWQYLPFRGQTSAKLAEILTDDEALTAYREDPFDPHAIAALRLATYQKAIVMKYIDNLLDWGDSLFAQDTRESITEAMMLYVLAFNLLGPRPVAKQVKEFDEVGTYEQFVDRYDDTIEFLTAVESTSSANAGHISMSPHSHLITHFCIPENEKFIGYWDLVEDRLYKIRHSLNIEGIFRQLALFQPPIDPAALVQAVAGGQGIGGGLADVGGSVPHYRYGAVLEQAKEVAAMVSDFGSAFFEALEANEDGQLGSLQFTHERNILNLTTRLKEFEVFQAQGEIEALEISKRNVEGRQEYYRGLLEDGTAGLSLIPSEALAMTLKNVSKGVGIVSGVFEVFAKMAKFPPGVTFGASGFGGSPVAEAEIDSDTLASIPEANAAYYKSIADALELNAELSQDLGDYNRRYTEWESEKSTADVDLEEINKQIELAKIRLSRAEFEQTIHSKELQQHQEVANFYRNRFVKGELRSWMVSRLSGLYFQAYKLAYDLAKAAEKALQYELPTTQTFITPAHWDSLRKGLLAGESLMLELNRMDKVRLDQDSRFQDIEKVISMKRTFKGKLDDLKQQGTCELILGEDLFNRDFPGHYCRLVKTIAISIVPNDKIDPYDAVHATLRQTKNETLLVPDSAAVEYLMTGNGEQPDTSTLRVNWRNNQQIAISKPTEDLGMFTLDFFRDDRYFPFEGTGAVSRWQLEMPKDTNPSLVKNDQLDIDDVVIHLRYTSKFDQGAFKSDVEDLMTQR